MEGEVAIDPRYIMFLEYRCPVCGQVATLSKQALAGNSLLPNYWFPDTFPGFGTFPPFIVCASCMERSPGKHPPRMFPELTSAQASDLHRCTTEGCGFTALLPAWYPEGWKCPHCRFGKMLKARRSDET